MKFTELRVTGYRSLVDITFPLRDLAVMIGPNGSGKTSLLDAFQLLKEATQENLSKALESRGGLNAVLSRVAGAPDGLRIDLAVDIESSRSQEPMRYFLELLPRDAGYVIASERLEWQLKLTEPQPFYYIDAHAENVRYTDPESRALVRPTWAYHHSEAALAQVPRMYAEPEALRSALSRTRLYSSLDVAPQSQVRLPQALTPTTAPGPDGEQLYSALFNLRARHRDTAYGRILDVLRTAFPEFDGLEFEVVGAGQVTMNWYQSGLSRPLYPSELSEGTLRFIWLIAVLLAPDPPPILLVDEPEVSLHPELLKLLAGLLQDASRRGQIVVATHSADLVRWLEPAEVLVLDKVEGRTVVTWADSMALDEWLKEYTLGELWQMGTLGGRP